MLTISCLLHIISNILIMAETTVETTPAPVMGPSMFHSKVEIEEGDTVIIFMVSTSPSRSTNRSLATT